MARTSGLAIAALRDDWAKLSDIGAAVRRSLDDALADLVCVAVEDPTASCAASCVHIDRVFEERMAPYCDLDWAMDQAATLEHALKEGLRLGPYRTEGNDPKAGGS